MCEESSSWEYNAPQFVDFNCPNALDLNDQADAWFDQKDEAEEQFFSLPAITEMEEEKHPSQQAEAETSVYYEAEDPKINENEVNYIVDVNEETLPRRRLRRSAFSSISSNLSQTSTVSAPPEANNIPSASGTKHPRTTRRSLQDIKVGRTILSYSKGAAQKTSEELELERIKVLRKQVDEIKKSSQKSLTMTKSTSQGSKRSLPGTQVTRPHEFKFRTDQRLKNHNMKTRQDPIEPKDFALMLRMNKNASCAKPVKGPTVPHPFHLTEIPSKAKAGYVFHSDAEKIIHFQTDTPERFRSRPRNDPGPPPAEKESKPKLTIPHTPNLVSRNRKRPITAVSAAEMEEKEIEEIKKFKFHAQPMNAKIFEKEIGIPKVSVKETTVPVGFDLHTEKRTLIKTQPNEVEETFEFKAQPVPRSIFEGTIGIKKAEPAPLTVPASPAFQLKNRIRSILPIAEEEAQEVDRVVRANPVPHHGVSFQPKFEHRATRPEPFSFDVRDKIKLKEKEDKIQQIIDEETKPHEFHAQPLPDYDAHEHVPKTKVKQVTVPEPFNLESVQRAALKQEQIERMREDELKELKALASFKARPNTVTQKEPFVPKRTDKPLTEINEFELNTERRAIEREDYEERKHEKDTLLEMMMQERKQRQEEEQRIAVAKLRQDLVHKAQPVKSYKPFNVHPSEKTLTEPLSPNFSDRIKK